MPTSGAAGTARCSVAKIRGVACADVKEAEAMEQIRPISRPCAPADVPGRSRLPYRGTQAA